MTVVRASVVVALMLSSALALAQNVPESLLPPGFDAPRPAARPSPTPPRAAASEAPASSRASAVPAVQPLPVPAPAVETQATSDPLPGIVPGQLPPLSVLERLSPAQLDRVLGAEGEADTPTGARRSPDAAGLLDEAEGGMARYALANQDASLVRAAIAGNKGLLVSRWGHILLRRALVSRLAPPRGISAADFAGLRAALLVRMGEGDAARALAQDVDIGDYTPELTAAAFDAAVATADLTAICPAMATRGEARGDPPWQVAGDICDAFEGDPPGALQQLDRALSRGVMPRIDLLLAQKYVGAAGSARRAVTIEWDSVDAITPWRFGLALAVGLTPPARLMRDAAPRYAYLAATAPMLPLGARAGAADVAGGAGVLSSAAMVDLYSQIYADDGVTGDAADAAGQLRDAYAAAALADRLAAMRTLWGVKEPGRYGRLALTAYAAARLPADAAFVADADNLVAAMLAAGLDANAARWGAVVKRGSIAWGQLALVAPLAAGAIDRNAVQSFAGADRSVGRRKTAFLVAGLAALGRIGRSDADAAAADLGTTLDGETRWTRIVDRAAAVRDPALVALLVGVGMQGDSWARMTPRFLYHIVAALRQAGLEGEARMIAAEAVARA